MPERAMMKVSADMPSAAPPVQPGMVATGVSISITYELVDRDAPGAG
jgi:uncharacterized protein YggE